MKEVALFLPHLDVSGGLGVHCRMLVDALAVTSSVHHFTIYAPEQPGVLFPNTATEMYDTSRATRFAFRKIAVPSTTCLAEPLDAILKDVRADLLYCSYYTGMKSPPGPQVVAFHDAGFLENPEGFGPIAAIRRQTIETIRGSCRLIQCISYDARERICHHLPWEHDRTEVVWHALPESAGLLEAAKSIPPRTELQPYFILPVGAATGFNRVRKNVPLAVTAFRRLKQAKLIIAGTAKLTAKVLAELLPATERGTIVNGRWHSNDEAVTILPTLERMEFLAAMHHAAAVIYPSRYEGFGLPTIEAMAMDVPLIAARATSIPEIVTDAGILVDPDDVNGFTNAMRRVLNEPMADLVQRGRERVKEFSIERLGHEMTSIFEKLL